jgi:hypothetical protein
MNNFRRGIDPKETLRIGLKHKAFKLDEIMIRVYDYSIPDNRSDEEKSHITKMRPSPQRIGIARPKYEKAHEFLKMVSEGKLWEAIYRMFPKYVLGFKDRSLYVDVVFVSNEGDSPRWRYLQTLSVDEILSLDGKIYIIPGGCNLREA